MEQKDTTEYGQRILSLVQLWRTGDIEESGYTELNTWFQSLEDKEIGPPVEFNVDFVEKRLHELMHNNTGKGNAGNADAPPHPWRDKKNRAKLWL